MFPHQFTPIQSKHQIESWVIHEAFVFLSEKEELNATSVPPTKCHDNQDMPPLMTATNEVHLTWENILESYPESIALGISMHKLKWLLHPLCTSSPLLEEKSAMETRTYE